MVESRTLRTGAGHGLIFQGGSCLFDYYIRSIVGGQHKDTIYCMSDNNDYVNYILSVYIL